ncbi:hypothetical protein [Nocardia africana]|uniref:Uncharacterized protein n=1 Tax=Nocardia africana TaxID=134964 RepID=A0ABW6N9N7_9NOCA
MTIATHSAGAATQPGTMHEVAFGGKQAVTIAPWSDVVSRSGALDLTSFRGGCR